MKKIRSPFRYPGGKYFVRKEIIKYFPKHNEYCEPFCGGGSIFFAKDKVQFNVLNDFDGDLINCYIQIRDNVENLIDLIDYDVNKEKHSFYKNKYKPKNELERAFRFFYLNRISFSGIMKKGSCYFGYQKGHSLPPNKWIKVLRSASIKLQNVEITCKDFEHVFKSEFLFVDPPYFNSNQSNLYTKSFTLKDHVRLMKVLKKYKGKFLLTYDDNSDIRKMYSWCNIIDKKWRYMLNKTKTTRKYGNELFILNYKK